LQYKLAHALNRLSFYYSGINQRGGTEDMTQEVSRGKAIEAVDEAINIFQEVCTLIFNCRNGSVENQTTATSQ